MKMRDATLFALPALIIGLLLLFAGLLHWTLVRFENLYLYEAQENIARETLLVADVLRPMLESGRIDAAIRFCDEFDPHNLRLSLIDPDGKVRAENAEKLGFLGNHRDRPEVRSALDGKPLSVIRYSSSLNRRMIYHAMLLEAGGKQYVLRAAVATSRSDRVLLLARVCMGLALALGAVLVFAMTAYILRRIRRPLLELRYTSAAIASGHLATEITIPPKGILRELAIDISHMAEQLKAQLRRITAANQEKETLFNAMAEAVLLIDENGDVRHYNHAAAQLFALKKEKDVFNMTRSGIAELIPLVRDAFVSEAPFEKEVSLLRIGTAHTLFVRGHLVDDIEDKFLIVTLTDLTNLRKLESFRSDFIANVSHEIRTPLTCIIGAVETLREEKELGASQREKLFAMLEAQSKRLHFLVQDILSLAAIERSQAEPTRNFAPVHLDSVLVNAVNLCTKRAETAGVRLAFTECTPVEVSGDFQLLEQAAVNLISNAIKYANSPRIDILLQRKGNDAVVTVRDYGIGISAEHHERIFERFYRVHKERNRELGGTGLGLAIVKHIAQLHNGTAALDSIPGNGCAFRIVIPLGK